MPDLLRETLPGSWQVLASTFPMWLSGRRINPVFTYGLLPGPELAFSDEVSYRTRSGATRRIRGTDRFDAAAGVFTWRRGGRAHSRELPQSYTGLHWLA